jgi:hypothetical protein
MAKPLPGPIAARLGKAIRKFRRGTSAAAVAREANELAGLGWTRVTVSRIELGQRGLTADEAVLLPAILYAATGRETTLAELLSGKFRVGSVIVQDGHARTRDGYEPWAEREARAILARYGKGR